MRQAILHRRRSPFSSALGSIESAPEIREVRLAQVRNHEGKVIVKDGYMPKTTFPIPPGRTVTFRARLKGVGYFWACVMVGGRKHLLFVTPASEYVEKTLFLEVPLQDLQFHISQSVPSDFSTRALDPESRKFLRENPDSYQTLGFIPTEPAVDAGDSSSSWNGRLNDHSWKYGYTGTQKKTTGKYSPWIPNFNGAWAGTSALYKYTENGWETLKANDNYQNVGTALCLVGQMAAYRDTLGLGGSYFMYGTDDSQYDATKVPGSTVRFANMSKFNRLYNEGIKASSYAGKFPPTQKKGGHIPGWRPVLGGKVSVSDITSYCAKLEWWNPATEKWSAPSISPPWDLDLNEHGRFAVYFRFPRQLTSSDEFYEKTPQWQWEKTSTCYPMEEENTFTRVGGPQNADGTFLKVEDVVSFVSRPETDLYYPIFTPPRNNDKDKSPFFSEGRDKESSTVFLAGSYKVGAVDPHRFSYADNPDILKASWYQGSFKPGGRILLIGKAMDMMPSMWVSSSELDPSKGGTSPFALVAAEIDENVVRDPTKYPPNSRTADRLNFTTFRSTDLQTSKKASFEAEWAKVFPNTPCTESIISLMLRGDQLPDLEGINNTKLPGFLDDDPLRYAVVHNGVRYLHPYTFAFAQIPEAWYGPSIEFAEDGTTTSNVENVWIGAANIYQYIKSEKVSLKEEILYQRELVSRGYNAAEAAAGSELENPMDDITNASYQDAQDRNNAPTSPAQQQDEGGLLDWFFRRDEVSLRHQQYMFGGLGEVGSVTDVTNKYSADHVTSLDGLSPRNVQQYGFNDLFIVNGMGDGPTMVLTPPSEPSSSSPTSVKTSEHFGSSSKHALMARAQKRGNPMKYSTESSLGSIGVGFGALEDTVEEELNKPTIDRVMGDGTAKSIRSGAALAALAGVALLAFRPLRLAEGLFNVSAARSRAREAKKRADRA